jgi:hypothetical protein
MIIQSKSKAVSNFVIIVIILLIGVYDVLGLSVLIFLFNPDITIIIPNSNPLKLLILSLCSGLHLFHFNFFISQVFKKYDQVKSDMQSGKENLLYHWKYSHSYWIKFAEPDYRKNHRKHLVYLIVSLTSVFILLVLIYFEEKTVSIVLAWLIILYFTPFLKYIYHYFTNVRMAYFECEPEVKIFESGVLIGNTYMIILKKFDRNLTTITIEHKYGIPCIGFTIEFPSEDSPGHRQYFVPIPPDNDKDAVWLVNSKKKPARY